MEDAIFLPPSSPFFLTDSPLKNRMENFTEKTVYLLKINVWTYITQAVSIIFRTVEREILLRVSPFFYFFAKRISLFFS